MNTIASDTRAAPNKYRGLTNFIFSPKGGNVALECWLEYERAERGLREWGIQMEPDEPETANLCLVEIAGQDIFDLLSESAVFDIENAFLEQRL